MSVPKPGTGGQRPRRTQAERSDAMRRRVLDATLECLQKDGYARTTVGRIIEVAGVSRGAPLHHFPSKSALIAAAAERLIRRDADGARREAFVVFLGRRGRGHTHTPFELAR